MLDYLKNIEGVASWLWDSYGFWGCSGIALIAFVGILIRWIATNPEKAERIYGWFKPGQMRQPETLMDAKAVGRLRSSQPSICMTSDRQQENYTWIQAVKAAASYYEDLHPGIRVTVKRWEVLGENARLEVYTQMKIIGGGLKRYRPLNTSTNMTILIIDKSGDILPIK